MIRNLPRFIFGLIIGGAFLFLCLKNVNWEEVRDAVLNIKGGWVFLSLSFYWLELWLRIRRWRTLLSHVTANINIKLISIAFLAGYAANNILPAKLGELFRADLLGRLTKTPRLSALGSIILERLLDMVTILGMAAWGILMVSKSCMVDQISHLLLIIGIILATTITGVLILILKKASWPPLALNRFREKFHHVMDGLHLLGDSSSYAKLISSSAAIWFLNSLAIWSILMALGINLTFNQAVLLMGIIGISAAIPAAPAGIGTLQYAFYLVFVLIDLPTPIGVVASVIVQLVLLGSATIIGGMVYHYAITAHLVPARK